ncbi:MAG: hypothetical protein J3R72DRAFT_528799 [Linnemannia gamsii]|nr:MAG: hypothetical protein J3R72DRAFT_528799 [Linnemannia gamsii]
MLSLAFDTFCFMRKKRHHFFAYIFAIHFYLPIFTPCHSTQPFIPYCSTPPSNDLTTMAAHGTNPNFQAVRRVYENEQLPTPASVIYLVCRRPGPSSMKYILWEDVLDAFKEDVVIHIRNGAVVLPFLRGPANKKLDPLCIAAMPGVTLSVVVRGRPEGKELSLRSLQKALPGAYQQHGGPTRQGPQATQDSRGININTGAKKPLNARLDDMQVQNALGDIYKGGREVHQDYQAAMDWYLKAAKQGLASAQFNVGDMYVCGRGVPKDYTKAKVWFRKAAAQDYAPAQNSIGQLYLNGQGVLQDFHEAMNWFIKAADQGNAAAQTNIGTLYQLGRGVAQDYSRAMNWYLRAAKQGNAAAQNNVGSLYLNGLGVPQDYSAAMDWYLKVAAHQGNGARRMSAAAQTNIGWLYQDGLGVPQDYSQAMIWYRRATNQGDATAQKLVARIQPFISYHSTSLSNDPIIMIVQDTRPNIQAVRRVYENEYPVISTTPASIIYLVCQPDAFQHILLWDDVLDAFKEDVIHIRFGAVVLPFLKGPDFRKLDPLRIAAVPGATLEVVIRGRQEERGLSVESLQKALPGTHEEGKHNNADPAVNTFAVAAVKQTPAGELVEAAWENYTHIDNPDAGPTRRVPQAIQDNQGGSNNNEESNSNINTGAKEPKASSNNISLARSPQESSSAAAQDITEIMMNARLGDMHAQNALGEMYKDGRGVYQDYQAAMDWYLKAAEQGLITAQYKVGWLYDDGLGVPQDYSTAMDWYLKAARQGDGVARNYIGILYRSGHGVPQDYDAAMNWFLKSANQGNAKAQYNVGWMYDDGLGVPQDYLSAMDWYLKAAGKGYAPAQRMIGTLYQNGGGVPQDCFQAMSWYRKAADQGNARAQKNIAWMYEHGMGVSKDREKAIEWYRKAIAGGYAGAKVCLDRLED